MSFKFNELKYERIDIEAAKASYESFITRAKEAESGEALYELHKEYYAFTGDITTNMTICSIRHGIDTTDAYYEEENKYNDMIRPILMDLEVRYQKVLYESPFRSYMEEKIGKVPFKNIELSMKGFDEKLIPLMQEENELASAYQKLIATAEIPFDGEIYNISLLRKHLTSCDRDTRKRAWKAFSDYFMGVTGEIDEIYDKMVKNRTAQAKLLGFENYVELGYCRMHRNSYDRKMVECFREQVKRDYVPFASMLHEKRRKRLGVESLKHYDNDVYFNEGNPAPFGTPEEILKTGQQMYRELSPETAEFFDFMMEHELFDVLGRKTKRMGAYMTYLPNYKAPFVFANFNGTNGDVDVITHECGHAFQGFLTRNEEVREVADITMETAEIHSMSMEYFAYGWMDRFFGEKKDEYLTAHFEDAANFVPYGCIVDEFQHIIYENPEMTPAERKQVWKELEKVYRPHLDYDNDPFFGEGGYWQRQLHIFIDPFYYIDYVLASICAMQFKVRMDVDFKEAWDSYVKLCRISAREFYVDMLHAVGLDNPFEDGCVKKLVDKLIEKVN